MQNAAAVNREGTTGPSMWWVGLVTVSLVWFVGASAMPSGLAWLDERLVLHGSAGLFLSLSLLLNLQKQRAWMFINLLLQAICASTFVAVDVSSSGPILYIVLVAQLPFVLGIRWAIVGAVSVNLVHVFIQLATRDASLSDALVSTALFACFQLFALLIAHFAVQASEARNALAATNSELLATRSLLESTARDRERLRVSRDLHDTAGHTLTALKLNLRQLRDEADETQRAALDDCLNLSSELLDDIRDLVGNLREQHPLDLRTALQALVQPFPAPDFTIVVDEQVAIEELALAENVLAIARESITNVVRHARASQCTVRVSREGQGVRLTIEDDGVGPRGPEGVGITGMRERIRDLGGMLEISPRTPSGTLVNAVWGA